MKPTDIIEMIDAHAAETGLSRATICERATGNTRLYERLLRRQERDVEDARRIRAYIEAHRASVQ